MYVLNWIECPTLAHKLKTCSDTYLIDVSVENLCRQLMPQRSVTVLHFFDCCPESQQVLVRTLSARGRRETSSRLHLQVRVKVTTAGGSLGT